MTNRPNLGACLIAALCLCVLPTIERAEAQCGLGNNTSFSWTWWVPQSATNFIGNSTTITSVLVMVVCPSSSANNCSFTFTATSYATTSTTGTAACGRMAEGSSSADCSQSTITVTPGTHKTFMADVSDASFTGKDIQLKMSVVFSGGANGPVTPIDVWYLNTDNLAQHIQPIADTCR